MSKTISFPIPILPVSSNFFLSWGCGRVGCQPQAVERALRKVPRGVRSSRRVGFDVPDGTAASGVPAGMIRGEMSSNLIYGKGYRTMVKLKVTWKSCVNLAKWFAIRYTRYQNQLVPFPRYKPPLADFQGHPTGLFVVSLYLSLKSPIIVPCCLLRSS